MRSKINDIVAAVAMRNLENYQTDHPEYHSLDQLDKLKIQAVCIEEATEQVKRVKEGVYDAEKDDR